ncbi:MAG: U32 family peptidase [Rhodothalassiaceae bacterium]
MRGQKSTPASGTLSLGPLLFNWPPERVRALYDGIAGSAAIGTVHIGEVVCAKRAPLLAGALAEAVARLAAAGKEIVLSTLALPADARELAAMEALVRDAGGLVEANDVAALALLEGRPHAVGPFINVYNEGTLATLAENGAVRVCLPPELDRQTIATLAATGLAEIEVQVFGRLPLALSARCYHARAHGLAKDNCRFVCGEDADGMMVETLDGEPFLAVNGIGTLSYSYRCLLAELDELRSLGVGRFRLSPHSLDMVAVAELFRAVLDGGIDAAMALEDLQRHLPGAVLANGYYYGQRGLAWRARRTGMPGAETPATS